MTQINTNTYTYIVTKCTGTDAQRHWLLAHIYILNATQARDPMCAFKNTDAQKLTQVRTHTNTHSAREPSYLGGSLDVMWA